MIRRAVVAITIALAGGAALAGLWTLRQGVGPFCRAWSIEAQFTDCRSWRSR